MSISVPPRGLAGSLASRQARPLNGLEVARALENHILAAAGRLLSDADLLSDKIIRLTDEMRVSLNNELSKHTRLQKVNITYPKVGWSIKIRLEEMEIDPKWKFITGEVELDLERNLRLNIRFGASGVPSKVISSLEEEKIPNSIPDKDRQSFGLKVEAEFLKPDGTTGKVDLNELKPPERRAARSVDVGRGRIVGQEVTVGEEIKLPSELPEVSLDDLVAEPPPAPKEPVKEPLPPKGSMAAKTAPNVKFVKGSK
jgi:hypothetical protein